MPQTRHSILYPKTHSVANFTKSIVCLIGFSKKHASNCLIFTTFVVARLAHRGWAGKHI